MRTFVDMDGRAIIEEANMHDHSRTYSEVGLPPSVKQKILETMDLNPEVKPKALQKKLRTLHQINCDTNKIENFKKNHLAAKRRRF